LNMLKIKSLKISYFNLLILNIIWINFIVVKEDERRSV
jgi:hypothetical protein